MNAIAQGRRKHFRIGMAKIIPYDGLTMEGPKVSERGAGGAKRRGGWGLGRGAVAPPQYGGLGAMPPENFSKNQR